MAAEFTGKIALDVRDSVADWAPYVSPKAPEGAPNVLVRARGFSRESRGVAR